MVQSTNGPLKSTGAGSGGNPIQSGAKADVAVHNGRATESPASSLADTVQTEFRHEGGAGSIGHAATMSPARLLALQRMAGNAATAQLINAARAPVVQRADGFTVTGLAVAGATAVAGAADTFVAPRGAAVTATATVVAAAGGPLPPNTVRWSTGRAGTSQVERVVPSRPGRVRLRARAGASERTVTIFIADAPPLPGVLPVTALQHREIGRSNPGTNFGLTVVTIGDQGVKGPTFQVVAFIDGAQWRFGVTRIRHGYKVGIHSLGKRDVPNAASVRPRDAGRIITDLTPPAAGTPHGPPRTRFWVRSITLAHEHAHVDHFYLPAHGFWPPNMNAFAASVAAAAVAFNPATARNKAQVIAAQRPAWKTAIETQHGAADAAEIASAETYAHGQSNPMYTALIAAIRASVKPTAPTALTATATAATSVTLGWNQDRTLVTSFVLERRTGRGPWTIVAPGLAPASATFTDGGLTANTRYTYRLSAVGAAGNSPVRTLRVRTTP